MPARRKAGGLADQLRNAIRDSGMSHYELAKRAGTSNPNIYRFLNRKRGLRFETVEKIADVLGLELTDRSLRRGLTRGTC